MQHDRFAHEIGAIFAIQQQQGALDVSMPDSEPTGEPSQLDVLRHLVNYFACTSISD
jgi:hypothetical protein